MVPTVTTQVPGGSAVVWRQDPAMSVEEVVAAKMADKRKVRSPRGHVDAVTPEHRGPLCLAFYCARSLDWN